MHHSQANGCYGSFADGRVDPETDRIKPPDSTDSARWKDGTIVDTTQGAQRHMTITTTTMRSIFLTAMPLRCCFPWSYPPG